MALGDQTQLKLYTIGKGSMYFQPDGEVAFRLFGNAPSLTFTQAIEELKHFSSREGTKKVDKTAITAQELSGKFALDDMKYHNRQLFFMSTAPSDESQSPAVGATATITVGVTTQKAGVYEIGYFNISNLVVSAPGGSPDYVLNTDYEVDVSAGLLFIPSTTGISDGEAIELVFDAAATTVMKMSAATTTTIKGHFMFIGAPAVGVKVKIKGYCSLKPGGDVSEITEAWEELPFDISFETHASYIGLIDIWDFGYVV